jgi:hypothetical protein
MTPETAMVNMNQRRQNICSTSKVSITSDIEDETVTPAGMGSKTHLIYAVVIDQGQLYMYIMGIFPVRSSKGNSPMCQLYSTDRLLMDSNDMTDALKHPHTDVPFEKVGNVMQAPLKAAENKQPVALVQTILTSPMKHNYQTSSQRKTN